MRPCAKGYVGKGVSAEGPVRAVSKEPLWPEDLQAQATACLNCMLLDATAACALTNFSPVTHVACGQINACMRLRLADQVFEVGWPFVA